MANAVYLLCAVTSAVCAVLLIREYAHQQTRLLLWSSLAFSCFAFSNALVFTDFVVLPSVDLSLIRAGSACLAIIFLLIGLVWTAE